MFFYLIGVIALIWGVCESFNYLYPPATFPGALEGKSPQGFSSA